MITWAERAKAAISQTGQAVLPKLTKPLFRDFWQFRQYLPRPFPAKPERLSSVLAVPSPAVLEKFVVVDLLIG
jgi:hypothetical protein